MSAPALAQLTAAQAARLDMALEFETMPDPALDLAIRAAVIEHGGTVIPPGGVWGPLECELSLLSISGTGTTPADAARNWTKHVLRSWAAMEAEEAA